ncbi:hypothetical protein ACFSUP_04235 [Gracilibacillus thailandensis]|uniref:hypothetical protein n=2 Tax=Bacillati TaxID=1783272 RepID=UPI0036314256
MSIHSTGQTAPEAVRKRPILRTKIWNRMHRKDKNFMGIVLGDTGDGKSEFGLRLCEVIDPNFSAEQVVFTIEGFMEEVNKRRPPGSAILFDEVGVALSASTHYDKDQIELNHVLETWREQNRMLIMTAPHMGLLQRSSRGLLHAKMEMWGINYDMWLSQARYMNIATDTDDGSWWGEYPRLRDPNTGQRRKYRFLEMFKPTDELVDAYSDKKIAFNDRLNEEVLEQVTPEEIDEDQPTSPQEVVERILEEDLAGDYVSIHGGHNKPIWDKELIRGDWGLSHSDATMAKKLLNREEDAEDWA